jgi:hypothetical protein
VKDLVARKPVLDAFKERTRQNLGGRKLLFSLRTPAEGEEAAPLFIVGTVTESQTSSKRGSANRIRLHRVAKKK